MKENCIYRRKNRKKNSKIEALSNAQKIAFSPFIFHIVGSMLDFGVMELLDKDYFGIDEITKRCKISDYCANILLQAAYYSDVVLKNENDKYMLSELGKCFLHDEMTIKNYNFMRDVCYLGASEMTNSLRQASPKGLHKFFIEDNTIYPHVPNLDDNVKNSWYDFDYYYSDNCYENVAKIIFDKPTKYLYDIGGNIGRFEKVCLTYNNDCEFNIIDLPVNKDNALKNTNSERINFIEFDVLSNKEFPKLQDTVFMSQFLDCFSKEQCVSMLQSIKQSSASSTRIFILEPIIDNQVFKGASFSLAGISCYFTCLANGKSKMFTEKEILDIIEIAGLKISQIYSNIGQHCYTLLECEV